MTTVIKCRDTLSVDGQSTNHNTIVGTTDSKLLELDDDYYALLGMGANSQAKIREAREAIDFYEEGRIKFNNGFEECDSVVVKTKEGKFYLVEANDKGTNLWVSEIREEYAAFGSGKNLALGALHASGNIGKAIAIVSKLDIYTGGTWQTI